MHDNPLLWNPGEPGNRALHPLGSLRRYPDLGQVGLSVNGAVHRLHSRVGKIGCFVDRFDLSLDRCHPGGDVTFAASLDTFILGHLGEVLEDVSAVHPEVTLVPSNIELPGTLEGSPGIVRHNGDTRRDLEDVTNARNRQRFRRIEASNATAENRTVQHRGEQQPFRAGINPEISLSPYLRWSI